MPMPLSPVSATWIMEAGASMGFDLSEADAQKLARGVNGEIDGYASLDTLAQPNANESISVNDVEMVDDPHNAYITRFIAGGGDSPLGDVDVAVKDNIAVAGVPMCGSQVFEGVVTCRNATVVRRLLEAGARLVGKTNWMNSPTAGQVKQVDSEL